VDQLFVVFVRWMIIVLLLFGAGMTAVILFGDHALAYRMVNIFASMFSAVTGLGAGYLLGARGGSGKDD
jgi:hypothetical protein